jgi:Homeodomain-like domain
MRRPRLTRIQKEARIIELNEAGYTVQEICSIVGCSATTAHRVIKQNEESREPKEKSKRSQALILFDAGWDILKVATRLDIPVPEAEAYLREYHYAKGINYLEHIRGLMGQSFYPFIGICQEMCSMNMSRAEIDETRRLVKQKEIIRSELISLRTELKTTSDKLQHNQTLVIDAERYLNGLKADIRIWQKDHDDLQSRNKTLIKENSDLESVKQSKIDSSEIFKKIEDFTKNHIRSIFKDQRGFIILILTALPQVLRQDIAGEFRSLLYPPHSYFIDIELFIKLAVLLIRVANQMEPQVMMAIRNDQYKQVLEIVDNLNSAPVNTDLNVGKESVVDNLKSTGVNPYVSVGKESVVNDSHKMSQ